MSNPIYRLGPITKTAESRVEKGRLVALNDAGEIEHAAADGAVFGGVTDFADKASVLAPDETAVHYGPAVIALSVAESAGDIAAGDAVFAAANGEVADTGTVEIGVAVSASANGLVETVLNKLPLAAAVGA